ncbi:hypothetical protein GCM10025868_13320 [Angustibacter aerolatus]|uniref:NAD-dependent epimerase/dehydratase domain-containing protein n=1 Tax=Angustibacter aerolatus TaxID=1162965 RepID=A0ABQ6JD20_9ACTN|nr:hypothetical protein GCM10025868_13320 [Angustibacter aerolatus]
MPSLMHHVHADDVAQVFALAVEHRDEAAGEDFHAVAPTALTVRGYAETAASLVRSDGRPAPGRLGRIPRGDDDGVRGPEPGSTCLAVTS